MNPLLVRLMNMDLIGIAMAILSTTSIWLPEWLQYQQLSTRSEWDTTYNYIIVGAGSAGAALARRLTEDPTKSVLLLEAGHPETAYNQIPVFWPTLIKSNYDWQYETVPQKSSCYGFENRVSRYALILLY